MDMTNAIQVSDESSVLDTVTVDLPEVAELGRWRTLALIAFSALSAAGFFYALVQTLTRPQPGSAAEATAQLLHRPEEPSAITVAIVTLLIVTVAGASVATALRRHAD